MLPAVPAQSEQPSWVRSRPHQSAGSAPGRQKVVMAVEETAFTPPTLSRISSSTCSALPLPHLSPHYKEGSACLPRAHSRAWHPASCQAAASSHTVKQMTQPDFRQKPCLSGSPRQMNSEFPTPGKPQSVSTHSPRFPHNTETSSSYIC